MICSGMCVNISSAAIPIVKSAAAHLFFCYILKYAFKEDSSGVKVSKKYWWL